MTPKEALELIKLIETSYHQINFDKEQADVWISILIKGDYQLSKEKIYRYVSTEKFPPVISDFLVVIQDKPVEDYSADIAAVQRELNDPVLRKKREEAMQKLREAVKGMNEKVGVSDD
ncbi:hypothetical protein [Macrococcus bovicus]|nr:hypothetical protein [Macrococcus bovicus]